MHSNNTNGTNNSSNSQPKGYEDVINRLAATLGAERFQELLYNSTTMRSSMWQELLDPRRDIDDECGYPKSEAGYGIGSINPDLYRMLYEREAVATRIVQCLPKESWQVTPTIYEDEDSETETEFEQAWDALEIPDSGVTSWHQDERGSSIWEHLLRADILSGIGQFGVILLGIDDGKALQEPVDGVVAIPEGYSPTGSVAEFGTGPNVGGDGSKDTSSPAMGSFISGTDTQYGFGSSAVMPGASLSGTDQQYFGVQFGPSEIFQSTSQLAGMGGKKSKKRPQRRLLFLRCFDESLVQVVRYEWNIRNPRFGQPVMYRVTLNDPREQHSGVGLPLATVFVHWSRIIHVADNLGSSEIFGVPRLRPVLNRVLDLRKLYSGSAEMYWRGAFPGFSLETHPQLGGDVVVDAASIRDQMEQYMNGLQRYLATMGMGVKSLAPQVVDPGTQIQVQLQAICIELAVPQRVFMGSERGELASSQDDAKWNDVLKNRQELYLTPKIIVPFVDRLILMGVLPEPKGYSIKWPNLESLGAPEKSAIALQKTQALVQYVSGGAEAVVTPADFFTHWLDMEEEEAVQLVEDAMEAQAEAMTFPAQGELGHPTTAPEPEEDSSKNGKAKSKKDNKSKQKGKDNKNKKPTNNREEIVSNSEPLSLTKKALNDSATATDRSNVWRGPLFEHASEAHSAAHLAHERANEGRVEDTIRYHRGAAEQHRLAYQHATTLDSKIAHEYASQSHDVAADAWEDKARGVHNKRDRVINSQWETPQEASSAAHGASKRAYELTYAFPSSVASPLGTAHEARHNAYIAEGNSKNPEFHNTALHHHYLAMHAHEAAYSHHNSESFNYAGGPTSIQHEIAGQAHKEAAQIHRDAIAEYEDRRIGTHNKGSQDPTMNTDPEQMEATVGALHATVRAHRLTEQAIKGSSYGIEASGASILAHSSATQAYEYSNLGNHTQALDYHSRARLAHERAARYHDGLRHDTNSTLHQLARDAHREASKLHEEAAEYYRGSIK